MQRIITPFLKGVVERLRETGGFFTTALKNNTLSRSFAGEG
jgi:hypothetical protein